MQIYNTLTGKKQALTPQDGKKIGMYVCGITPYDKSHLGHARTLVAFDLVRRYLLFRGYAVRHVQNVTDIDDKIIRRAHERKMAPLELSRKYDKESEHEFDALGIMRPDESPRVSGCMPEIISLIARIEKNGFAYATESGVYFDVMKFSGYGKLSGQDADAIRAGARIEVDEKKRNPQDFALWKLGEEPGVTFDSPWGRGRPGWHIECSAMSTSRLGETIDVHGGARDLIFPHHENEIAQSESATGKPFVKIWMHTGFLTVNGEKMAKSLGNFVTIEEGLKKFPPQAIRMLFALSHYRSPIDFSENAVVAAQNSLETLHAAISAAKTYPLPASGKSGLVEAAAEAERKFIEAMDDDFDTPNAMSALFALAKRLTAACSEGVVSKNDAMVAAAKLERLLGVFNLAPVGKKEGMTDEEIEKLVAERDAARKKKDFAASDRIRKELAEKGILLEDRKDGTTGWRRK